MPTEFENKVYNLTSRVPKGRVTTYKEIAKALGIKAYRAVGNSLNKNPFAPRVPCHRVVNSNGSIGGFASGSRRKAELLRKESVEIKNNKIINFKEKIYRF